MGITFMFKSKLATLLIAGVALGTVFSAPASASVLVQYAITFLDPPGTPTGGTGILTLNETTLGNLNENAPTANESLVATVDGFSFTIDASHFSSWSINLQNGIFNNLGLTSSVNFAIAHIAYLQTSGGAQYQIHQTQGGDFVSNGTFTIGAPTQVAAVPEPSTWAMLILGFMGIGAMTYRQRKRAMLAA
jgi:hypothetical protein